jgi:hypothetical protein
MKIILTIISLLIFSLIFSQEIDKIDIGSHFGIKILENKILTNDKLNIDSFFKKKDELLIDEGVLDIKKSNLIDLISVNFNNITYIEKKRDKVIFTYIDSSFYLNDFHNFKIINPWIIKVVIKIENQKLKYSFYDKGNSERKSTLGEIKNSSYYFIELFTKSDNMKYSYGRYTNGLVNLKESIKSKIQSLEKF